ncbi:MAG: hypothetical protein IJJ71_07590, partial [Treponema sp.]|nr:hypothetical protein [Treponema sp.]
KTLTIESGVEISSNSENGNETEGGGGGIFNSSGTVIIKGGTIKTNSANHYGGAIYNESGTVYIYGDTLIGNVVSAAPTDWYYGSNKADNGGAIYNKSGNIYIGYKSNNGTPSKDDSANVKIMGNAVKSSSSKGGAIYVEAGTLQIAKTCIDFNYSPYSGAGIYTKGSVRLLEDAIIKGNKAFSFGGGVYVDQGGQLDMGGNSIIGGSESGDANTAAKGGGVYVSSSAQTTPAGVTFGAANSTQSIMGNSSTQAGGGVYINGFYATFTMHSGSISNNKLVGGTTGGGGIHVAEGTLNFEGGEISGNVIETPSNTNIKGGALDIGISGKFNIKGAVSIPYGEESGKNDVRINTSTAITITGAITGTDTDIRVIPYSYSEGEAVLALADAVTNTTIAKTKRKFSIMPDPAHPENDWHINSEGNLTLLYIGSKKPSEDKAIGDIVFNDGSAEPYTSTITQEQKNAAIAVIFYDGVGDSDLGNRVLGVALQESSKLAWASNYAKGHGSGPMNSTPPIPVEKYDGKANLAAIKALGDYKESYYPAFYYAEHYSDNVTNLGDYQEDWYLPAYMELSKIKTNMTTVNAAFDKLGSIKMFLTNQNKRRFWSSTNYFTNRTTYSQNDKYGIQSAWAWDEDRFKGNGKENGNICYVRVIHEF